MTVEMAGMDSLFGSDRIDTLVERLWRVGGWKADPAKDRGVMDQLVRDFPTLDLAEELSKFETWVLANGDRKMVSGSGRHARLRNWCSNAVRFARARPVGRNDGRVQRTTGGHRSPGYIGGAPASAADFGQQSGLVDWT
jgi:hypothetical protein